MRQHWFSSRLRSFKDRPFLIQKDRTYTYNNLIDKVEDYKKLIQETKIPPQSNVALIADYSIESIALLLALFESKMIVALISETIENEIQIRLEASQSEWKISLHQNKPVVFEPIETITSNDSGFIDEFKKTNDSGFIIFTSGSTGFPKAILHDFPSFLDTYKGKRPKQWCFLLFLLFDHIGGLNTLFNVLSSGAKAVIPLSKNPIDIANTLENHSVNVFSSSPSFLNLMLLQNAFDEHPLKTLKTITHGTEHMPEVVLERLKKKLPNVYFIETFGTSETGIIPIQKTEKGTFFQFKDTNNYKIVDGELWLSSKMQTKGYLNADKNNLNFTQDGWFKTGDLVKQLPDGSIKILGRKNKTINIGGQKVLPSEIENILMQIPEIHDCTVFAEDHPFTGQTPVAKITPSQPIDVTNLKKIVRTFCRNKLALHKIPTKLILLNSIELTNRLKK